MADHPKLQKIVDAVKADYLDPEYPREMLVTEVTDLRAQVGESATGRYEKYATLVEVLADIMETDAVRNEDEELAGRAHDALAALATVEAGEDDGPGNMICKAHEVTGCAECWAAEMAEAEDDDE